MRSIESRLAELERIKEKEFSEPMSPVELAHWFGYHLRNYDENPTPRNTEIVSKFAALLSASGVRKCSESAADASHAQEVERETRNRVEVVQPELTPGEHPPAVATLTAPKPSPNAEIIRQRIREMKRPKRTAQAA
jgi:hypothetical protein